MGQWTRSWIASVVIDVMFNRHEARAGSRQRMIPSFARRLGLSLQTGYVFLYYGELVFWTPPEREGISPGGLFLPWLLYSVCASVFLELAGAFRARNGRAVFLTGSVYGWFERAAYICSNTSMPNASSPCFNTRAVRSQSTRRLARKFGSAFSTGQFSKKREKCPARS